MNFLPDDYKSPKSSNHYMKLQDGENKIRILTQPILGWEDWHDKKPVRYKMNEKPAKSYDPKKAIRHFWSFIVWNYNEEQIQILHLTQATIRNCIEALCKDEDWGSPYFYDIKIIKKGEGTDTEYMINPLPHKPLPEAARQAFYDKPCNLDALFTSEDPFAEWPRYTPGMFDKQAQDAGIQKQSVKRKSDLITEEQARDFDQLLAACDEDYQKDVAQTLKEVFKVSNVREVTTQYFDPLISGVHAHLKKSKKVKKDAKHDDDIWAVKS